MSSFGSKCELTSQLLDKVAKCGVMDNILSFADFKNQKELKKSDGAKRSRLVGKQQEGWEGRQLSLTARWLADSTVLCHQVHRQSYVCVHRDSAVLATTAVTAVLIAVCCLLAPKIRQVKCFVYTHGPDPLTGISKLSDANDAGTRNSHLCTLILTEGDSAKTLAISGLSVVGYNHFGVFPLR